MYVLSCEPATCAVPEWHKELFRGHEETVTSGEGWSPGSLNLAQAFATQLRTLLAHGDITRLLVDFSRPPEDPERFSRFALELSDDQRRRLDERHHQPFFNILKQRIAEEQRRCGRALHLSIRTADRPESSPVALIHDPTRALETAWVEEWTRNLRTFQPDLPVEATCEPDYPLSVSLRREFPDDFGSISLVVAESCFLQGKPIRWDTLKKALLSTCPRP